MKVLDLHGVRHEEVERLLENFILLNEPPLKVITGNSTYMQTKLEEFCNKHKMTLIFIRYILYFPCVWYFAVLDGGCYFNFTTTKGDEK